MFVFKRLFCRTQIKETLQKIKSGEYLQFEVGCVITEGLRKIIDNCFQTSPEKRPLVADLIADCNNTKNSSVQNISTKRNHLKSFKIVQNHTRSFSIIHTVLAIQKLNAII